MNSTVDNNTFGIFPSARILMEIIEKTQDEKMRRAVRKRASKLISRYLRDMNQLWNIPIASVRYKAYAWCREDFLLRVSMTKFTKNDADLNYKVGDYTAAVVKTYHKIYCGEVMEEFRAQTEARAARIELYGDMSA